MEEIPISKEEVLSFIDFMNEENNFSKFHLSINLNFNKMIIDYTFVSTFDNGKKILFQKYDTIKDIFDDFVNYETLKCKVMEDFKRSDIKSITIFPSLLFESWETISHIKPARG